MKVLNDQNVEIDVLDSLTEIGIEEGQKINAPDFVIDLLADFAKFTQDYENRKAITSFSKYAYIIEKLRGDNDLEGLNDMEKSIVNIFNDVKMSDLVILINLLIDIKYPILNKFLLNLMDFVLKYLTLEDLEKLFEESSLTDEELPDYII